MCPEGEIKIVMAVKSTEGTTEFHEMAFNFLAIAPPMTMCVTGCSRHRCHWQLNIQCRCLSAAASISCDVVWSVIGYFGCTAAAALAGNQRNPLMENVPGKRVVSD